MNVRNSLFLLVFVLLACDGCSPVVGPKPDGPSKPEVIEPTDPEPEPEPEALPEPLGATCESACTNQRALECELGEPTPKGATCEEVCENAASSGLDGLTWDVQSLTEAKVCE